jgi:hypothetical protein
MKQEAYLRLTSHVLDGGLVTETSSAPLDDIADAWKRQAASPNTKLVIIPWHARMPPDRPAPRRMRMLDH